MLEFPQIAATTERLGVASAIRPAIENRDDVVEFQVLGGSAIGAERSGPIASLAFGKLGTMASKLGRLSEAFRGTRLTGNDSVAVFGPHQAGRFGDALASFFGMPIAESVSVASGFSFPRSRDNCFGGISVMSSPKLVPGSCLPLRHAGAGAGNVGPQGNMRTASVEGSSADRAVKVLAFSCINAHHASTANGVNSGKHLDSTPEYKSILSQAKAETPWKVQRLGDEANASSYASNSPTSALPERDDIVRAAWRHAEVGSKRPYDNTTDDVIDTTPMDGITSAFFNWVQLAVSISISRIEERKNSGEYAMLDLLEEKSNQAMDGITERFNKAFLQGNGINSATAITTPFTSTTNGSTFFTPLPLLVGQTPTAGTIGSIAANVSDNGVSWWANQKSAATDTNFASFFKDLDKLRNNCSKGVGGAPDIHLVDQSTFELYVAALRKDNRFTDTTRADIPFDNVAFHGKPVTWDEFMPNWSGTTTVQSTTQGSWVMLNSKNIQVKYDKQTNFTTTPFVRPENQDAKTAQILWYGTLGCNNRRKLGVLSDIDTTLTS